MSEIEKIIWTIVSETSPRPHQYFWSFHANNHAAILESTTILKFSAAIFDRLKLLLNTSKFSGVCVHRDTLNLFKSREAQRSIVRKIFGDFKNRSLKINGGVNGRTEKKVRPDAASVVSPFKDIYANLWRKLKF
jgi:hypothetical protein